MSPRTKRILVALGAAIVALNILLQFVVHTDHGEGWIAYWYQFPGFYAALGFVGCIAIVVVSKWLGKVWLQRPENYYGEADPDAD